MSVPDSTDEQIARLLGEDARQDSETLAKKLNISAATVRRRIRKLLQSGLLHIVGVVDPAQFGLPLTAIIAFDVEHNRLALVTKTLAKLPEISRVTTTTGRFDIMIIARFPSTDCLSEFMTKELAQLEGVKNFETFICLNIIKGFYIPFP